MINTGEQLAQKCLHVAKNVKTLYVLGCFGWPMNQKNKNRVIKAQSFNAEENRSSKIVDASCDTFGFDCVCFVKALLWGWEGDASKVYGGATYKSNGVPDINDSQMLSVCKEISSNFTNIQPGEFLWTDGHCGIYVGDGVAVECTYRWKDGVQITSVYNITGENGSNGRYWKKHGKLPYISYRVYDKTTPVNKADYTLQLVNLQRGSSGALVRALQLLLIGNGYSCGGAGADGDFGANTEKALKSYQKDKALTVDGIAGKETLSSLLGVIAV